MFCDRYHSKVLSLFKQWLTIELLQDIDVLCERCRDKALAVRKQSLASLTEVLLQCPRNPMVQRCDGTRID